MQFVPKGLINNKTQLVNIKPWRGIGASRHLSQWWLGLMTYIWVNRPWWWRVKSPASRLFPRPFVQAQIKENIKSFAWLAFVHPLEIPLTKGQERGKRVHLMTSPWISLNVHGIWTGHWREKCVIRGLRVKLTTITTSVPLKFIWPVYVQSRNDRGTLGNV